MTRAITLFLACIALLIVPGCRDEGGDDPGPAPVLTADPNWQLQLHHSNILSMSAVDADHVWISILDKGIRRSADGGATWTDLGHPGAEREGQIKFVSPTQGWMKSGSVIYSTSNAGDSWVARLDLSGQYQSSIYSTSFVSADIAWVARRDFGFVYHLTTDGGATWTPTGPAPGTSPLLKFFDDHSGLAIVTLATGRRLFATRNAGATWQQFLPSREGISAFAALDMNRIWVAIRDGSTQVLRSNDGGATWSSAELDVQSIGSIEFVDATHGWLTADGRVYRSQDGGVTWAAQQTPDIPDGPYAYFNFSNTAFVGARTGWVTGYHGNYVRDITHFLMKATADEE